MDHISNLLNHILIISNLLFKKNTSIQSSKKPKQSLLIEFCPSINLQSTFHILLAIILKKKFEIIFFYFGGIKINFFSFFLRFFLKKLNYQIIELKNNSKVKNNIKKFTSKKKFIEQTYKGLKIGKFIYQSYCRLYLKETLDLNDDKLYKLVNLSHARIKFLEKLFHRNKIKYVLTTHVVFVNYGLIALVAKKFNSQIKIIYPEKNYSTIRTLSIDNKNLLQIDKYYEYKKEFKKIRNKKECLEKSKNELNKRIFKNITNWKVSNVASYSKNKILKISGKRPKIIILPSCFFDANQFFRHSLFVDVYEWLDFTLYHASKTNFDWYVKPHPTRFKMNIKIFKRFEEKYKNINFLEGDTSNLTFIKNKFSSMFTYQSTASHEFAFLKIPSIVAGDSICANYDFAKPPKSINEYKNLIYNADKIDNKIKFNDVLEFNYMWRFNKSSSFSKNCLEKNYSKYNNNDMSSLKNSLDILNKFFKKTPFQKNLYNVIPNIFK